MKYKLQQSNIFFYAALAVVVLIFFNNILFTANYIFGDLDLARHYFPFKNISTSMAKSFQMPLWMPQAYCGMPLLGSTADSILYPFDILCFLLPIPVSVVFNYGLIIHVFLGGLFMFLFIRELFEDKFVAFLCGIIYMFSGDFLSMIDLGGTYDVRTFCWIPLLFYLVERGIKSKKLYYFMIGAVVIALQIISTQMQIVFYTWLALIPYFIYRTFTTQEKFDFKTTAHLFIFFAIMLALGVTLSAVFFLPNLEYAKYSVRNVGKNWYKINPLPPEETITYLIPEFFGLKGHHHDGGYWGRSGVHMGTTIYFGILPVFFAIAGIFYNRKKYVYFFFIISALALIFSFGDLTPVSNLLCQLPPFYAFRVPKRILILLTFGTIVMAAAGMKAFIGDENLQKEKYKSFLKYNFFAVLFLVSLIVCAFIFKEEILDKFLSLFSPDNPFKKYSDFINQRYDLIFYGIIKSAIIYISLSLLLFANYKFKSKIIIKFLIAVLLTADIWIVTSHFYNAYPVDYYYKKDEIASKLEKEFNKEKENKNLFRISYLGGLENYFVNFGIDNSGGFHPVPLQRCSVMQRLVATNNPNILNLTNTKYVISYNPQPPLKQEGQFKGFQNPTYFPRVFLARNYIVISDESRILEFMQGKDFKPKDILVLEKDLPSGNFAKGENTDLGTAEIMEYKANKIKIKVSANYDCFLFLSDSYYPGWKAAIDNNKTEIFRADYNFKSVYLNKGTHEVTFIYSPLSFKLGALITGLSLLLVIIYFIYKKNML